MTEKARVIIIYNADASVMGKLTYAYRKLRSGKHQAGSSTGEDGPVCGNCDITHGGLSLSETSAWTAKKRSLEEELDVTIEQRHRDELDSDTRAFSKANNVRYPTVLYKVPSAPIRILLERAEVNVCALVPKTASSPDEARAEAFAQRIKTALEGVRQKSDRGAGTANL